MRDGKDDREYPPDFFESTASGGRTPTAVSEGSTLAALQPAPEPVVIPRRLKVGEVVKTQVGDTTVNDLMVRMIEELKVSKIDAFKTVCTHEAPLTMKEPLTLVPQFQCGVTPAEGRYLHSS